jgi:hypothetical protein
MDVWQYPIWAWWNPLLLFDRVISSGERYRVPTEDYQPIKMRALACYRSQTEPLPPQLEAALPSELSRIFTAEVEYYFRFLPPAAVGSPAAKPPIV